MSLAMANLIGGGFLIVATFAFSVTTAAWLASPSASRWSCSGWMAYLAARGVGAGERIGVTALGTLTSLVASWTIVASLVFAPATARWLIFASACAYVALSMASLVIREVTTERVVHHLEVGDRESVVAH